MPVIASHSAFRHFTPGFERNISDELAKLVAARGGVVVVPFGTAFIDPASAADTQAHFRAINDFNWRNAERKGRRASRNCRAPISTSSGGTAHPPRQSTLAQVLDQIDYGVKLLGVTTWGIGSGFRWRRRRTGRTEDGRRLP